jgi:hypothetical protein
VYLSYRIHQIYNHCRLAKRCILIQLLTFLEFHWDFSWLDNRPPVQMRQQHTSALISEIGLGSSRFLICYTAAARAGLITRLEDALPEEMFIQDELSLFSIPFYATSSCKLLFSVCALPPIDSLEWIIYRSVRGECRSRNEFKSLQAEIFQVSIFTHPGTAGATITKQAQRNTSLMKVAQPPLLLPSN